MLNFGPFQLDLANEQLWRGRTLVPLKPRAFAVLCYLVERSQRLVTKDELLEHFWSDVHVGDAVLKTHLAEIRRALGDDIKSPRFIETAHRRGYRFIAATEVEADQTPTPPVAAPLPPVLAAAVPPAGANRPVFVGREEELARLDGSLQLALGGQRQLVFLTGEPGIGKSTLARALLDRVAREGNAVVARGQCIEHYGSGEAYLPVLEAIARLASGSEIAGLLELLKRHAPSWLSELPGLLDGAALASLAHIGVSPQRRLREMADAFEAITKVRPLVLLIEDLHWADPSTFDLLSYLARRTDVARLLVLATYRPGEVLRDHPLHGLGIDLQLAGLCTEIALDRLDGSEIEAYLAGRFPEHRFPSGFTQFVSRRTDGSPLFLVRLLDSWQAHGFLRRSAGHWQLSVELSELTRSIPESLVAMIQREVERLPAFQRSVLEAASAAGAEFSTAQIAAVLQADPLSVEEVCLEWCRREQYVRPKELPASAPKGTAVTCAFRHALFQQVAYERTGAPRRAQLHQRLGVWMENAATDSLAFVPELARHFELAGDAERAVRYLQAAGEHALQRSAHREAVGYLRRGFEQLWRLPESAERDARELLLDVALGSALSMTEGSAVPEALELYQRARVLCLGGHGAQAFPAVMAGLFLSHTVAGNHRRARDVAQEILAASVAIRNSDLELMARYMLGTSCSYLGELSRSKLELERACILHDPERHRTHAYHQQEIGVGSSSQLAFTLWLSGYPDRALQAAQRAFLQAQRLGHAFSLVFAETFLAVIHQFRGEYSQVGRHSTAGAERAAEHGFRLFQGSATVLWGVSAIRMGDESRGLERMKSGEQVYDETGSKIGACYKKALLAAAYTELGQLEQAAREVAAGFVVLSEFGEPCWEAELYRLQGELRFRTRPDRQHLFAAMPEPEFSAEQCLQKAIGIAQQQEARGLELRAAIGLATLWQAAGHHQRALELLTSVYDWFQEGFETADLQRARALIAELRSGKRAKAAE